MKEPNRRREQETERMLIEASKERAVGNVERADYLNAEACKRLFPDSPQFSIVQQFGHSR